MTPDGEHQPEGVHDGGGVPGGGVWAQEPQPHGALRQGQEEAGTGGDQLLRATQN